MKKYKVLLQGDNFLLDFDGKPEKHGSYTTIFVEAIDPEEAEKISINLIRNDPDLKAAVLNRQDDPPMIYTNEVNELISFEDIEPLGGGYTFYPENAAD